jgi:hypothetical protein
MTNITRIILGDKVLAELLANKTVTILGKDRKLDGNIVITFGIPGSIEYDNLTTTIQQGQTATLECEGLIFKTNVIVKTFEDIEEPDEPIVPQPILLSTPVIYLYNESEEPEEPVVPIEPVELETPFIYLEDVEEDDEEGDATCAVLGVGKLG